MNALPPQQQPVGGFRMHDPLLQPFNGIKDGKMYRLVVEQQPVRARMCGFGDKDRRPITPPPCVRLIVSDYATGKEIDANDIDSTFFVLTVDLWDADGGREVNLVRHSSGAPTVSISSSTTTSYPPAPERTVVYAPQVMAPLQTDAYGRPMPPYQSRPMPGYGGYPPPHNHGAFPYAGGPAYPPSVPMTPIATPASNVGMFTRNLIGSLAVNAFKLNDTNDKLGFWFVLQDLSVRTEGSFRLKMNFVDVGANVGNNTLNTERAPVLATCFSEPFQVFSAKKFPGVIESTPLSKTFAQQGIKIPIRKDGPKSLQNAAEYDD